MDQAGALGDRDERHRWQQSALRVLPADQGLDAEHPACQVALRLVVQHQLARGERPGQLGQQAQPLGAVLVQVRVVHADARVAALGVLGRDVGVPQQAGTVGGVGRVHGHTGPGVQCDLEAADLHRLAQRSRA